MQKNKLNIGIIKDQKPFRIFKNGNKEINFYYYEDLNIETNHETEPIIFNFYNKNKLLIIFIEKEYYEITGHFFKEELLLETFNSWLINKRFLFFKVIINVLTLIAIPFLYFLFTSDLESLIGRISSSFFVIFTFFYFIFNFYKYKGYKNKKNFHHHISDDEKKKFEEDMVKYIKKRQQ